MFSSCKGQACESWLTEAWETMLLSWKKGGPTKSVDSWFHFVWIKESRRISHISLSGERGGPACGWWKVESSLWVCRKMPRCCAFQLSWSFFSLYVPSIHKQIMTQSFSNIPLCSNIQKSTFPHQPKAGGPPFLSRTGNLRAPALINSNSFCEIALFIFSSILISSSKNVYLLFYAISRRIVNR